MSTLESAIHILRKGGTILYPTDTIWGIGSDATNPEAISKIYKINKRKESKSLITLVANKKQLKEYTNINIVEAESNKPTTIIYPKIKGLAHNLLANNGSAAIRIVQNDFCKKLIFQFGKPIVSTSANISGEKHPNKFMEIKEEIIKNIDYVVNLQKDELMCTPSNIIQVNANGLIIKKIR